MRHDDVVLLAYPKCGTHWIWEVLTMLLSGKAEYEKRIKEYAMMEVLEIPELESQPSPRILNTHLPLRLLPGQIKGKKVKVIHLYRNVKDVFVSKYFHNRQIPALAPSCLEEFEAVFMSDFAAVGNYFKYMKEMHQYRQDNPDLPFFTMSFEDCKENPQKMLKSIAQFIGVTSSPELIDAIAEATSINKMREAHNTTKHIRKEINKDFKIYRKGEVGDWKTHLTVAMSERFDAAITQLRSCDYHFRYEL